MQQIPVGGWKQAFYMPTNTPAPLPLLRVLLSTPRQWLRGLLQPSASGAPSFLDTFRLFHPQRRDAYTCWQAASGARVNNYGSRIDFVLAADGTGASASDWVSGGVSPTE